MLISQKNKISWTDFTWSPITGCKHNCPYCYLKLMDHRFKKGMMDPKFHEDRLNDIAKSRTLKPGDKIFVVSAGDMWGEWVPADQIEKVLDVVRSNPELVFQFLTKNPLRYADFFLPENGWYGTTQDGRKETEFNVNLLVDMVPYNVLKFVSFEPLLKPVTISHNHFKKIDWIIIGADSSPGAEKPPKEWADKILFKARSHGKPVWIKSNYKYPDKIQEFPQIVMEVIANVGR